MTKQWIVGIGMVAGMLLMAPGAEAQRGSNGRQPLPVGSPNGVDTRSSGVTGPSLGYVWDASTANIHMVRGIAGSSLPGGPMHRGAPIRLAAISPTRDYAVVADESDDVLFYGEISPRGARSQRLWQDASRVTHAAVSPGGDRFAVLSAESGRVELYRVDEGEPTDLRVFAASNLGEIRAIAVSDVDDAVYVIRGGASGITRIAADGIRSLLSLPGASDLAFFSGSKRVLLLDAAQNALYEADLGEESPSLRMLASQADGIEQPSAMALSGDDKSVAIASASLRQAVVIELATKQSRRMDLPEAPTGIRRLNARGVFQLTDARTGPMLLLEVQQDRTRTVYVPRAESARSGDSSRTGAR